jgi:hypothetical protein
MATPIEVREEVDVVSVDPLFVERQRNRYASRAVAYVVWLNGIAAIGLLVGLPHASLPAEVLKRFADAITVFGVGSLFGLASAFFAYVGRTLRLEHPDPFPWRRPLRWLAILAAVVGALCFIGALNKARVAVQKAPVAIPVPITQPETTNPQP